MGAKENTNKKANQLLINDINKRIRSAESSLAKIPKVEREFRSIERLQDIHDNIFTFLLRKQADARITSSSNFSDTKILEPAMYFKKMPVKPNRGQNYLIAIFFGLIIPLFFMQMRVLINDKVTSRIDINRVTSIKI